MHFFKMESHCLYFQQTVLKLGHGAIQQWFLHTTMPFACEFEVRGFVCDLATQNWDWESELWMQCWDRKS